MQIKKVKPMKVLQNHLGGNMKVKDLISPLGTRNLTDALLVATSLYIIEHSKYDKNDKRYLPQQTELLISKLKGCIRCEEFKSDNFLLEVIDPILKHKDLPEALKNDTEKAKDETESRRQDDRFNDRNVDLVKKSIIDTITLNNYAPLFEKKSGRSDRILGVVLDNSPLTKEEVLSTDFMNDSSTKIALVKKTDELDVAEEEIINIFNDDVRTNYKIEKVYANDHENGKFYTAIEFVPNVETVRVFKRKSLDYLEDNIDPYSLGKSAVISLLTDNIDMHYHNALVKNVDGKNEVVLIDPIIAINSFENTRYDFISAIQNKDFKKAKDLLINITKKMNLI